MCVCVHSSWCWREEKGKKRTLILLRDSWPFRRACWVLFCGLRRLQYWKSQKLYHPEKSDIFCDCSSGWSKCRRWSSLSTPRLQTVAIPPSARHPSIWHKPLKPIPHHREWTSKWPLLASFFLQPKSTGQMLCWRAPNIALKPSKILGLVHTQRT